MGPAPDPSSFEGIEGDVNVSPARAEWSRRHIGAEGRRWLDEDARYFLHQALSTPCLNVLAQADGITRVRAACDRAGALLIFDEIPQCLGRTGRMFASEHFGVTPDILVLGKGLGGGILPMAAMVARPELDVMEDRALGHYTHEKNPVTCAAALATIGHIEREGLVEHAGCSGCTPSG